ncbi:MAG: PQQ-dependent sugar dehydrogenase [Gammaproteobacteria bacterium]|nr:PQQ-dependent sugar dehydrogenase [Gammaproteobacteria bacterium]MYE99832.1 PQQ-dependent sugar dehydrogenase [Gammaproteobacteria bacterium]
MKFFRLPCITACLCMPVLAQQPPPEPLADPIPGRIEKSDIAVALEDFVQLPRLADSSAAPRTSDAHARIQYLQPLPDGSGRLAVNDLRGVLYLIDADGGGPHVFLDMREQDVAFDDSMFPNETGLLGFAFHPDFGRTGAPGHGRFYTAYSATSVSGVADYLEEDSDNHESVIREWIVDDPGANAFSGASREVFRIGQFAENHNIGNLAFNPAAAPGDDDYGMLYVSLGDGGGANDPGEYGQSTGEPLSSIMRIDPLGPLDRAARYRIPQDNPFVDTEGFAPEIWVWGLRHPQHFSFDNDGTLYINDIGQTQIEEVNIGVPGANYGWRLREGTFATAFGIGGVRPNPVYPRPEDEGTFEYPVAQYDHDEGRAIGSGYVYRGESIPELYGKYVFADLVNGRIFHIESEGLTPGDPAPIRELRVFIDGEEHNIAETLGHPNTYSSGMRADLRLGIDSEGELYALTKGDGWVRKIVPGR